MVWIESILICPKCGAEVEGPRVSIVELRRAGHHHDPEVREPKGPGYYSAKAKAHRRLNEILDERASDRNREAPPKKVAPGQGRPGEAAPGQGRPAETAVGQSRFVSCARPSHRPVKSTPTR